MGFTIRREECLDVSELVGSSREDIGHPKSLKEKVYYYVRLSLRRGRGRVSERAGWEDCIV